MSIVQRVCIIGATSRLGKYMIQHCLDRGYHVNCVCREQSVGKLDAFKDKVTVFPGESNDEEVIASAVQNCQGVLSVLIPWGVNNYSSGNVSAVLKHAEPDARLVFSCGWHISRDGTDKLPWTVRLLVPMFSVIGRVFRILDLNDQYRAADMIFKSDKRWTLVRGSDLTKEESQGLPVWADHAHHPRLASNSTPHIDFALFMVHALENDKLIHRAPAINGCKTKSALEHPMPADGDEDAE